MPKRTSEISRTKEREREERMLKYTMLLFIRLACFVFFHRHLHRVDSLLESEIIRGERRMEIGNVYFLYMWRKATSH